MAGLCRMATEEKVLHMNYTHHTQSLVENEKSWEACAARLPPYHVGFKASIRKPYGIEAQHCSHIQ